MTPVHTVTLTDWKPQGRHQFPVVPTTGARVIRDLDCTLIDEQGGFVAAQIDLGRVDIRRIDRTVGLLATIGWEGPSGENRLSGFGYPHRVFGTTPPVPMRRRYGCQPASFGRDHPEADAALTWCAQTAASIFASVAPAEHAAHTAAVEASIRPGWRIGTAPWTSGIINRTVALPYHRDAGNLKGCWSAQITLRKAVSGGLLHLPECDLWLATAHRSLTVFNGQGLWHGVTPVTILPDGYRYSIVFYVKRDICKCLDPADEPARAQAKRTEAEERMAQLVRDRAQASSDA